MCSNDELKIHPGTISQFNLPRGNESCYGQAAHYLFMLSSNNRAATLPDITLLLKKGLKYYCDVIENGKIGTYRSIYISELESHQPLLYDCNNSYELRAAPCTASGKFEDVIMNQLDTSPYLLINHNHNVSAIAKIAGRYHFFDSHRNSAKTGLPTRSEQGVAVYITTDKRDFMHTHLRERYAPSKDVEINLISFISSSEPQSSGHKRKRNLKNRVLPASPALSASFSDTLLIPASQDTRSVETSFSDVIHISASDARSSVEKRKKRERTASPSILDACTEPSIIPPSPDIISSAPDVTDATFPPTDILSNQVCSWCKTKNGHKRKCRVKKRVLPASQTFSASCSDTLLLSASQDTRPVAKKQKRDQSMSPASSDPSKKRVRPSSPAPSSSTFPASSVTSSAATRISIGNEKPPSPSNSASSKSGPQDLPDLSEQFSSAPQPASPSSSLSSSTREKLRRRRKILRECPNCHQYEVHTKCCRLKVSQKHGVSA